MCKKKKPTFKQSTQLIKTFIISEIIDKLVCVFIWKIDISESPANRNGQKKSNKQVHTHFWSLWIDYRCYSYESKRSKCAKSSHGHNRFHYAFQNATNEKNTSKHFICNKKKTHTRTHSQLSWWCACSSHCLIRQKKIKITKNRNKNTVTERPQSCWFTGRLTYFDISSNTMYVS